MTYILDTCIVIWSVAFPEKLSQRSREILESPPNNFLVSAISCGELACAVAKNRIELDRHWRSWFRYYIENNDWECVPIDWDTIEEAYSLPEPFHSDPADRIITATARLKHIPVLTADIKILDYPHVKGIW